MSNGEEPEDDDGDDAARKRGRVWPELELNGPVAGHVGGCE